MLADRVRERGWEAWLDAEIKIQALVHIFLPFLCLLSDNAASASGPGWPDMPLPHGNVILFILAVLGLCRCVDFSLVAASGGCSPAVVHGILVALASLVAEHAL